MLVDRTQGLREGFLRLVTAVALLTLSTSVVDLSRAQSDPSAPLRVAVKEAPPFVLPAEGDFEGITVELWRSVSQRLGRNYTLEATSLEGLLTGVAEGRYDVGVGALTVTAAREQELDFSHPFFSSGLGIATTTTGRGVLASMTRVFSAQFVTAVAGLAVLLLSVGLLVWWFERSSNPEEFPATAGQGLWSGFWFAAVSMTTVGYGDKAPRSVGGRLITLVWMFASIILISFFTAAIATALTVQSLESRVTGPEDLPGVRVASVTGTTSGRYLEGREIDYRAAATVEDAVRALAEGHVDAVVYDRPILRWLLRTRGDASLQVLPEVFERQDYSLVLANGSPLREQLNRALLEELRSERWQRLMEQYLGR